MRTRTTILSAVAAVVFVSATLSAIAQTRKFTAKAPTAADWAALAKLPDFTGVWEVSPGTRGGGAGAAPARPSLTPAYEAKRKAFLGGSPRR